MKCTRIFIGYKKWVNFLFGVHIEVEVVCSGYSCAIFLFQAMPLVMVVQETNSYSLLCLCSRVSQASLKPFLPRSVLLHPIAQLYLLSASSGANDARRSSSKLSGPPSSPRKKRVKEPQPGCQGPSSSESKAREKEAEISAIKTLGKGIASRKIQKAVSPRRMLDLLIEAIIKFEWLWGMLGRSKQRAESHWYAESHQCRPEA